MYNLVYKSITIITRMMHLKEAFINKNIGIEMSKNAVLMVRYTL